MTTADDQHRRLIDENLVRAELTEIEQAENLQERNQIWDSLGGNKVYGLSRSQPVETIVEMTEKVQRELVPQCQAAV